MLRICSKYPRRDIAESGNLLLAKFITIIRFHQHRQIYEAGAVTAIINKKLFKLTPKTNTKMKA